MRTTDMTAISVQENDMLVIHELGESSTVKAVGAGNRGYVLIWTELDPEDEPRKFKPNERVEIRKR